MSDKLGEFRERDAWSEYRCNRGKYKGLKYPEKGTRKGGRNED